MSSFVGRRHATSQVKLALSASRLVTLTGVGGVGKTRLALHVAYEVRRNFAGGMFVVELAKLAEPSLVAPTVADVLGIQDQSDPDTSAVVARHLADRQTLVVLDNCEHVLGAVADLAATLLSSAPRLRLLATSREPLGITGETVWVVPPLSVGTPSSGADISETRRAGEPGDEAQRLFEDRASAANPEFRLDSSTQEAVDEICSELDGLPLAIELAAVRVRAMSTHQIAARLQDRFRLLTDGDRTAPVRHRTLRATVDWSHDLCNPREQWVWAACSVFAGDFDLEAAEHVCATEELPADQVLPILASLVEKSILTFELSETEPRYRMLETIRQYGQEQLESSARAEATHRQHRDYYLTLVERADAESCGPQQAAWLDRLHAERPNIWAALDFCATVPNEADAGVRMGAALWFYWIACGFLRDGKHWMDRLLAVLSDDSEEYVRALLTTGWTTTVYGDSTEGLTLLGECRRIATERDDEAALTSLTQITGLATMLRDDLSQAIPLLDAALERFRSEGAWTAPRLLVFSQRGTVAAVQGDIDQAISLYSECKKICDELGERWALSWSQWTASLAWWVSDNPRRAVRELTKTLAFTRDLRDYLHVRACVELLAWVESAHGDPARAATLLGAASSAPCSTGASRREPAAGTPWGAKLISTLTRKAPACRGTKRSDSRSKRNGGQRRRRSLSNRSAP